MAKGYPTSKTQDMVLAALNLTATDFADAERQFAQYGLVVGSKRVGRSVEPEIRMRDTEFGAFNQYGEGETWEAEYKQIDLAPIAQWIVK
jgi:hypothetical protein